MKRFPRYTALTWKSLLVLPIFTVAVLTVVAGPSYNSARVMDTPIGPLTIFGYVYDLEGQPLEGASVVVTIVETSATATGSTGADGRYQASEIDSSGYDLGFTIHVVATYNSAQESIDVLVDQDMHDFGIGQVDVQYTYEIPEFGGGLGFALVLVVVCAIALVMLGRRPPR